MGDERDAKGQSTSQDDMQISKTSTDPIVMAGPDTASMVANVPYIASMNVNKSVGVHIGTKVVSITQNVQNTEGVRDMSFPQYLLSVVKDTTRAERAATIGVIVGLVLCITIITCIVLTWKDSVADVAPHEWNISRQMWLARQVDHSNSTLLFSPVDLVIIQHTVSPECLKFAACASEMRNLQSYFIDTLHYDDIAYNFLIGNDGRVYEGRGWGVHGAHTRGFNKCSLGIAFIGDYRENYNMRTQVTAAQINRTQILLENGVKMGFLHPNYKLVGGRDLQASASPGSNLYNEIRKWPHYDHSHIYKNKTCDEIYLIINNNNNDKST